LTSLLLNYIAQLRNNHYRVIIYTDFEISKLSTNLSFNFTDKFIFCNFWIILSNKSR